MLPSSEIRVWLTVKGRARYPAALNNAEAKVRLLRIAAIRARRGE
ncbi:hypothetical protein U5903_07985 [Cereibacter johrii]|nr:hypothetical protein [Cereibacter johrii]MEA5160711.1 hypothetical protein [Cereibacter johrii]